MLRRLMQGIGVFGVAGSFGATMVGCLDRPVTNAEPTVKTNFTSAVNQKRIDKIDVLFDIDNSASMGDKQAYLVQAIPQMIARLVTPRCVDSGGTEIPGENADVNGKCAKGTPEFPAVHDMHIGVVTSSLGSRGGDVCSPTSSDPTIPIVREGAATISRYNDDQGHLVNRLPVALLDGGTSGAAVPDGAAPLADPGQTVAALPEGGGFLSWFPTEGNMGVAPVTPPVAITASADLSQDFGEMIGGAGQSGCGIESQLESWYRFLIQPDPYATIPAGTGTWSGVDTTIIQQRHDFLRPDSLVVVMVLSDENDSEIDVRSFSGTAVQFMDGNQPLARGTSTCITDPGSADCTVCPQGEFPDPCTGENPPKACSDPNCSGPGGYEFTSSNAANDWGFDTNLRHVHMQQKYGIDPQFPLTRYFNGLTSPKVPNRLGEYPSTDSVYQGTNNCVNPLFAGTLPTATDVPDANEVTPASISGALCNLNGTSLRTAADVFFAHIGGVPHQLLQAAPGVDTCPAGTAAADCPQKSKLGLPEWTAILGLGPATYATAVSKGQPATVSYDYTNIDPHMVESQSPRNATGGLYPIPATNPAAATLSGPALGAGSDVRPDPISGREFITTSGYHSGLTVDREYACIFPLPVANQRDCATVAVGAIDYNSCDCAPNPYGAPNSPEELSPLCSLSPTGKDYTVQTYAKAYPTIRELTLASMMGDQGIVSSLCPIHTVDNATGDDPLYGYRPAVNAVVDRLTKALTTQCVPPLTRDDKGDVPCLVLVSFGPESNGPASESECATYGTPGAYSVVPADILSVFQEQQRVIAGDSGDAGSGSLANEITCELNQVPITEPDGATATCTGTESAGWCYVTGAAVPSTSSCSQTIAYSSSSVVPNGATINLQCISAN